MKYVYWLWLGWFVCGWCQASEIAFTVSMDKPETHYLQVQMTCQDMETDSLTVKMPVWTPGYYKIMDHSRHVLNMRAADGQGRTLTLQKTSKNTWQVQANHAQTVLLNYEVYAYARSVVDSYLDDAMAFLSPTGLFVYPEGQLRHPVTVQVAPYADFQRISTGLDPVPGQPHRFTAANYDVLYDCPILVGNQDLLSFQVQGIPHNVAVQGSRDYDQDQLVKVLSNIVENAVRVVGDIPYQHYSFLMLGEGQGGLEHANSMAVYTTVPDFNDPDQLLRWESFMTHEFFHLYNVKSIRPIALGPFDYERENYTTMLWFSEGGTVYYEYLILNRAGLMPRDKCLEALQDSIVNVESVPGHRFQSAAQSSFDAWLYFLNRTGDTANTAISYYDKGAALCMLLDLIIRHETNSAKSLDDVMRQLYQVYFQKQQRGFTDAEFRQVCEKIAGCSLKEFFDVYVNSTAPIDYGKILAYAGLDIATDPNVQQGIAWGAHTRERDGKLIISQVEPDSAAANAGLSIDDELIAWNGERLDADVLTEQLEQGTAGQPVTLLIARRGQLKELTLVPTPKTDVSFAITEKEQMTDQQRNLLNHWLAP